jgi:hypothetical protein
MKLKFGTQLGPFGQGTQTRTRFFPAIEHLHPEFDRLAKEPCSPAGRGT